MRRFGGPGVCAYLRTVSVAEVRSRPSRPRRAPGWSARRVSATWARERRTRSSGSSRSRSRSASEARRATGRAPCGRSRKSRSARSCCSRSRRGSPPTRSGASHRASSTATRRAPASRGLRNARATWPARSCTARSRSSALSLVVGLGSSGGNEQEEAAKVLDFPLGRWLVAAVGAGSSRPPRLQRLPRCVGQVPQAPARARARRERTGG